MVVTDCINCYHLPQLLHVHLSSIGEPTVTNGPNWDCVANITKVLREDLQLPTTHMISVGGWDSPHPGMHRSVFMCIYYHVYI